MKATLILQDGPAFRVIDFNGAGIHAHTGIRQSAVRGTV